MSNTIDPRNILVKLTDIHYIFDDSKYLNLNEYVLDSSQVFLKRNNQTIDHGIMAITNRALYFKKNLYWQEQKQQDYVEDLQFSSFPKDLEIYPFAYPGIDQIYDTREVFQFSTKKYIFGQGSDIKIFSKLNSDVIKKIKEDFNYEYKISIQNTEEIHETFTAPKWFVKSFEKIYDLLIEMEESGLTFEKQLPNHFGEHLIFGQEIYPDEGINSHMGYVDLDGSKSF